jgi:hypothetical protein
MEAWAAYQKAAAVAMVAHARARSTVLAFGARPTFDETSTVVRAHHA